MREETTVKVYGSPKNYHRDATKMAADGWRVVSTSERQQRRSCIWIVLFFPVLLWPPKPEIVVSYARVQGVTVSVECPRCHAAVPLAAQFCPSCGLKRINPPS